MPGGAWLPGSPYFATLVIWASGLAMAEVAHWLRLPRVIGMLLSGPLLANVAGGAAVAGFPPKWGTQMRAGALATIFLRCGLELEFKVRGRLWLFCRLAFLLFVSVSWRSTRGGAGY